jgi:hypothetical protein
VGFVKRNMAYAFDEELERMKAEKNNIHLDWISTPKHPYI